MTLKILVPCKRLSEGKSRLSRVLTLEERHDLCREFLEATLELATAVVPATDCLLVTGDPEAVSLASDRGVAALVDPGLGLNPSLRLGRDRLFREGATSLLVLPIDLPYADTALLRKLIGSTADIAIAPDKNGQGTNVLRLGPKALNLDFRLGIDSFAAHSGLAREAGLSVEVFEDSGLGFDIDRPEDLAEWRRATTS